MHFTGLEMQFVSLMVLEQEDKVKTSGLVCKLEAKGNIHLSVI